MLAFIHISKTGGSTVTHTLRSSYGLRHCQVEPFHSQWNDPPFSAHDLQGLRRIYPTLKSIAGHRIMGYVDLEDGAEITYFTFMRDPIKAAASRFQSKVQVGGQNDLAMEDWVQKDWTRNRHTKQIAGVDDVAEAIRIIQAKNIFVGLTEHFDESLMMMKAFLASDLRISHKPVNVARDNTLARELLETDRTRRLLIESETVDLELYDYVRRELYPTYRREYGASLDEDVRRFRETQTKHFNHWNRTLSRMKHYMVYKPSLHRYRRGVKAAHSTTTASR